MTLYSADQFIWGQTLKGLVEKSDREYDSITLLLTEQSGPTQILYIVDYIHKILEKEITIHLLYTPQTFWNRLLIADFMEHISKYLEEKYGIKLKESQEGRGIIATLIPATSPVLIRAILKDRIPNNSIVIAQGMLIPSLLTLIEGWREGANKVVLLQDISNNLRENIQYHLLILGKWRSKVCEPELLVIFLLLVSK